MGIIGAEISRLDHGAQMVSQRGHDLRDSVDRILNAFCDRRARAFSVRSRLAGSSAQTNRRSQLIGNAIHLLLDHTQALSVVQSLCLLQFCL